MKRGLENGREKFEILRIDLGMNEDLIAINKTKIEILEVASEKFENVVSK